jgi:hypothetical protein
VLLAPCPLIQNAERVSLYHPCPLNALNDLADTKTTQLFLEYGGGEGNTIAPDSPLLSIKKIYANLRGAQISGGYSNLFRVFCSPEL